MLLITLAGYVHSNNVSSASSAWYYFTDSGALIKTLVCLQLSKEDCRDALEMICNLESDGDEKAAFSLCSAFLTRQLLQGDTYCAW